MGIPQVAKAVVAGVGATLTAVLTLLATVTLVVGDDAISFEEIGTLVGAVAALVATVRLVWRVPNATVPNAKSSE